MKLLFCPECSDIFKLTTTEVRQCKCGRCRGKYINNTNAVTNGNGLCIAMANPDISSALASMMYDRVMPIRCWARPHQGKDNPHTQIRKDLI